MPSRRLFLIALMLCFSCTCFVVCGQKYVGAAAGYGQSKLFNYSKKDDYDATYRFENAASISAFYEGQYDSTTNFRIELGYEYQQLFLDVANEGGTTSFNRRVDYSRQLFNLSADYVFLLQKRPKFGVNFLLGMTISYNINTSAAGTGLHPAYKHFVDSTGHPWSYFVTEDWGTHTKYSRDLSQMVLGVNTGLELYWALTERLDFIVQNRYYVSVSNIWSKSLPQFHYTSVLIGSINIGLRRNI